MRVCISYALLIACPPQVVGFDQTYYARLLIQYSATLSAQLFAAGGSVGPPGLSTPDTTLDISRLNQTIHSFTDAAIALKEESTAATQKYTARRADGTFTETDAYALRSLNDRLMYVERAFILPEGLPTSPWFKHVINSPSITNSYAASSFPGVSDALSANDWRLAQRQLDAVCHLIQRATQVMRPLIPY